MLRNKHQHCQRPAQRQAVTKMLGCSKTSTSWSTLQTEAGSHCFCQAAPKQAPHGHDELLSCTALPHKRHHGHDRLFEQYFWCWLFAQMPQGCAERSCHGQHCLAGQAATSQGPLKLSWPKLAEISKAWRKTTSCGRIAHMATLYIQRQGATTIWPPANFTFECCYSSSRGGFSGDASRAGLDPSGNTRTCRILAGSNCGKEICCPDKFASQRCSRKP